MIELRKEWMGLLARSTPARLKALMPDMPPYSLLRSPEVGAMMVRGRQGATGAPFNLGEVTVTRCAVQLGDGTVGHAVVQGRDKEHALRAAIIDAQMQGEGAATVRARILDPLRQEAEARRRTRAAKAAATKVEFFTMARGED